MFKKTSISKVTDKLIEDLIIRLSPHTHLLSGLVYIYIIIISYIEISKSLRAGPVTNNIKSTSNDISP